MSEKTTGRVVPYLTEMFRFQAWVALGKVAHPMSGEVERDLDGARAAIDLLNELESKTAGNRSDEESKLMQAVLTELRMNYVDEAKKPAPEAAKVEAGAADGATDSAEAAAGTGAKAEAGAPDADASAEAGAEAETPSASDEETTRA